MRRAAHFLSLTTLTTLLVPALEVTATATQYPEFFDATRLHRPLEIVSSAEVPPTVTIPRYLAQVEGSQSDTVRLFERALEQFNRSQFREAIVTWEQVLNLVRDTNNRNAEGIVLNVLGEAYFRLSQYEQAIDLHEEALEISREVDDRVQEGGALMNLGNVYLGLGEFQEAINFYQQALTVYSEIGDYRREGTALGNLGNAYRNLAQYERAIEFSEQHLAIAQNVGDRPGEGLALGNLGVAYLHLGQYERAIDLHQQQLAITREIGDRAGEGLALGNLGSAYDNLGEYEQAIDLYQQQLKITREIGDRAGESLALGSLGVTYWKLGQYERSIDFVEQQLTIAREIGSRTEEGIALGNLGFAYKELDDSERALEQYGQAVALLSELGFRLGESYFLSAIGQILVLEEQPEMAIVFLKASVDVREAIRGDIRGLDTDLQQSFTDTVADDYRLLADLLLQQNRIIEAQRVLDLLKVQELDDYLDDVQRNAQTETGVDFWQPEEDVLALYDDVLLTGTELQRLQALATLTPDEQARLAELEAQQNRLYTSFIDWLDHPQIIAAVDQLRVDTRSRTLDIDNFTDLQASLRQLPQTSVILYPLVLEERLELVLVSADAPPVRYPIDVDATTLNRTVVEFGQALKDRRSDPRPSAQQLYDWVIAPLEAELAAVGAENIIFAPDGVLRYVPLAALHDGDQWLIERFTFNQITAASETDFAATPRNGDSRSLLAAACADCTFSVNVGDDTFSFGNLPATRQEVETLVAQIPDTEVLIDGDFTPEQFQSLLSRYPLIHLATHGLFVSGAPEESFVLFGDGQHVNLRQMKRDWQQMDADLVVLSACETALGSAELGDGVEVLGLGFQLQQVGAKAVLASLWKVSDQGTQILMTEFYNALNQSMTKAEALQAAQQALITGESELAGEAIRASAPPLNRDSTPAASNYSGYSHPYYWAPFILIGNGL